MLEEIRELQTLLLKKQRSKYKRYFFDAFNFDRMSGIIEARGVEKTTLLLQYLKENTFAPSKKLYVSTDSIKGTSNNR